MSKLTNQSTKRHEILSSRLSSPFSLCFKYKLENGYTFLDMDTKHVKTFQKFLNQASQMTFEQAERLYRRKSDTTDVFSGDQVIHYGISEVFRIHGVIQNGQFVVIRLDPMHKFHK